MQITKSVSFHLTMTESEADWLKEITQNPISENESKRDCEIRTSFFTTLLYKQTAKSAEE